MLKIVHILVVLPYLICLCTIAVCVIVNIRQSRGFNKYNEKHNLF